MFRVDGSVSDRRCAICGEPLYNDPHQEYLSAYMAAEEYFGADNDEELDGFIDYPGEGVLRDGLCGRCSF